MESDLDLESFRIVRAIAERGSITAAAQVLGWSQPSVSKHLRKLEAQIGLPVVQRVGRGVRLTGAGEAIARHAGLLTSTVDAAKHDLAELRGLSSGSVRIVAFPTASSTLVPELLQRLREHYPGITASYEEAEPPEALGLLRSGMADVAITFRYSDDPSPATSATRLRSFPLFTEDVVAVLPEDHPLSSSEAIPLAQLASERWIAGCVVCRGHLIEVCRTAGFEPIVSLATDNALAVLQFVSAGMGVALLPRLALASTSLPPGVVVRSTSPTGKRWIDAAIQPGSERIPSVAVTLRFARALGPTAWARPPGS